MGRFEDSRYIRIKLLYTKWWFFSFLSFWFHHNLLALLVKYHLLTRIKFMYVCVRMNSKFLCCWDKTKNYCCVLTWFRLPIYNTSITNKCLIFQRKKLVVDVYAITRITSRETRTRKKITSLIFPGAILANFYM